MCHKPPADCRKSTKLTKSRWCGGGQRRVVASLRQGLIQRGQKNKELRDPCAQASSASAEEANPTAR